MASAVLANRNELSWPKTSGSGVSGSGGSFMGKFPFSNPNPNPKFNKNTKSPAPTAEINGYHVDESPAVTQSASDDAASSINRKPGANFSQSQYRSFDVDSYSTKEVNELRSRLIMELEQIRQLKDRIESGDFRSRSTLISPQKKSINKKVSGNKRSLPADFNKDSKKSQLLTQSQHFIPQSADLMKSCAQVLTKLMKHKNSWIFNSPVDVRGLGLHDYYDVVKHPMDLGTVKMKLGKNLYSSPSDFAADVRLTFNNAMLYNPRGHEVYAMAEQLLMRFEELFRPMNDKLENEHRSEQVRHNPLHASPWNHSDPAREKKDPQFQKVKKSVQRQVPGPAPAPQVPKLVAAAPEPVPVPTQTMKPLKQPKPRAKDPNKREMSMEEKHKLGIGLQSLPQEKMEQVVQIIKKRNGHLAQDGDEIELDIETVDTETLWELDRFVTNWKKLVSKIKRQGLMNTNISGSVGCNEELPMSERIDVATDAKKPRKGEAEEEDVDIGDDIPMSNFPAVEIEKDDGRASSSSSSSSSSGSDSSSSSDSDSGSSSGSDSDADNAQS